MLGSINPTAGSTQSAQGQIQSTQGQTRSAQGPTHSSADSCVAESSTGGATSTSSASSLRMIHRHQRCPGFRPGNPHSGTGWIDRCHKRLRRSKTRPRPPRSRCQFRNPGSTPIWRNSWRRVWLDGGGTVHWRVRRVRMHAHPGLCAEKLVCALLFFVRLA